MKKFPNDPDQITGHHIIPSSRSKGKNVQGVCNVPRFQHERYHNLFGNMIPKEIVEWLNQTFWNEMFEITIKKIPPR